MTLLLGLDIGSNSVGSALVDDKTGRITVGVSVFPAGVDESDEKRGDPKNAKRRMMRRSRITLARRSQRKRLLRLKLISAGLLPTDANQFKKLLEETNPWDLRRKGLMEPLRPTEFGRVLLHLAQRRGAVGFDANIDDTGKVKAAMTHVQLAMLVRFGSADAQRSTQVLRDQIDLLGKKKKRSEQEDLELDKAQEQLKQLCKSLLRDSAVTYGRFIADLRDERRTPITTSDQRQQIRGPREWRKPVRNKAGQFEFHADRTMIRQEFAKMWDAQTKPGGALEQLWRDRSEAERKTLVDDLRSSLDNEAGDSVWRHKGLLFGQRKQSWDLGTLGRCVLEPTERCAPHADMYASRYRVIETVNSLKIIEGSKSERSLTPYERKRMIEYLSGPLGIEKGRKKKGDTETRPDRPKTTVSVTDLRHFMGWGKATKSSEFRFTMESDPDREINTDWFYREIVHGAIGVEKWNAMQPNVQEGINRAILKHDSDEEKEAAKLKADVMRWAGLSELQADALVAAWRGRPRPDAKRLNMSRHAVCNLLTVMDRDEPWPDEKNPGQMRWLDQNTARRLVASTAVAGEVTLAAPDNTQDQQQHNPKKSPSLSDDAAASMGRKYATESPTRKRFVRAMRDRGIEPDGHPRSDYLRVLRAWEEALGIGQPEPAFDEIKLRRYATGAKGATARDRYYMKRHKLKKNGKDIIGPDGKPLAEPPPAPLISNPVVRKAIHEVRRHLVEYLTETGRKPHAITVELAREAKMGKVDADRALFINRLRSRIKNKIVAEFDLDRPGISSTQRETAVLRVVLCLQQGGACPFCGKELGMIVQAVEGKGCELSHIIPRACGGGKGLTNLVLAHEKCNREMSRRTPRQFWEDVLKVKFEDAMGWVEQIYGQIKRIKPSETKTVTGAELWKCYTAEQGRPKRGSPSDKPPDYFARRADLAKIEQFKREIKDTKEEMTLAQLAATKYASRQVMAYLADGIFEGNGLPERGGHQLIFATDGMWTTRLRNEWGLRFDIHGAKIRNVNDDEKRRRREKNRSDHRHHAIDAIVIALSTAKVKRAWEEREKRAEAARINTADAEEIDKYRENYPLDIPAPFKDREQLHAAVERAVFGDGKCGRPVCHRPVKRKLIGAFHKATQYGPVLETVSHEGQPSRQRVEDRVTIRQDVLGEAPTDFLKPSHLRRRQKETDKEAIERLMGERLRWNPPMSIKDATKSARKIVNSKGFVRKLIDPKPEKGGIVRDYGLRELLRRRLQERGLNPDAFTKAELKQSIQKHGPLTHESGVPIHRVVLLWSNNDPVTIKRDSYDYASGKRRKLDEPSSLRLFDSQNNHHIEIRVATNKKGVQSWSGEVVTSYEAAQRKLKRLRAFREAGLPNQRALRKLAKAEREKLRERLKEIERTHPLVDRSVNDQKGGRFVMSVCEGEMLMMKHKHTGDVGYFVVAKLDKPQSIVLVPHWDARAATERKDAEGKKVPDSKREQFAIPPSDLKDLAPPGYPHAVKVRVSPLRVVQHAYVVDAQGNAKRVFD